MGRANPLDQLSRRERQIMDVVYRLGRASVTEVRDGMDQPPSYSAVRATMNILEEKGVLRHKREGNRYVYAPTKRRRNVRKNALGKLVDTFFDGSREQAMAALLDLGEGADPAELARLEELIRRARKEGR